MKLNSLIETIKGSIATETPSDVRIVERSLLFDLFKRRGGRAGDTKACGEDGACADAGGGNGGGSGDGGYGDGRCDDRPFAQVRLSRPGRIWSCRGSRYPLCSMAGTAVVEGLLFVVDIFYWVCSKVAGLFLGRKKWFYCSPRFNFVVLAASVVGCISLLVSIFTFYINDVLFFNNVTTINRCGALVTRQACGVDHYMYLFNTADPWSDTGIEVLKGDRVRISGSGAFYSDILDMKQAAERNDKLRYRLSNVAYPLADSLADRKEADRAKFCMYWEEDAVHGSLLYQIIGETQQPRTRYERVEGNPIHQVAINRKGRLDDNFFEARESGVLHVAVNDIYLDSDTIDSLEKQSKDTILLNRLCKLKNAKDSIERAQNDPQLRAGYDTQWLARAWFNDNCGDILLNVTIERRNGYNPYTSLMERLYIRLYRLLSWFIDVQTGWIPSHPRTSLLLFWVLALAVVYLLVGGVRFLDRRCAGRLAAKTAPAADCPDKPSESSGPQR